MKKFSFIIFIIVNMLILMALSGCRKERDVSGDWTITTTRLGVTSTLTYNFDGEPEWGSVTREGAILGSYSIDVDIVSFTLQYLDAEDVYTVEEYEGLFDGVDFMRGQFTHTVQTADGPSITFGNWSGER